MKTESEGSQTVAGGSKARSWPEMEALRAFHCVVEGHEGVLGRSLQYGKLVVAWENRKERRKSICRSREEGNDFESILSMGKLKLLSVERYKLSEERNKDDGLLYRIQSIVQSVLCARLALAEFSLTIDDDLAGASLRWYIPYVRSLCSWPNVKPDEGNSVARSTSLRFAIGAHQMRACRRIGTVLVAAGSDHPVP